MAHRIDTFQRRQGDRQKDAAVSGLGGEFLPQYKETDHEQDHVGDEGKITGGDDAGLSDKDGKTCDPSKGKVIGKLEEVDTDSHNKRTGCKISKVFKL